MPVFSLNDVLGYLGQLHSLVSSKNKYTLQIPTWINTLRIIDRLDWNMRFKAASKIYPILRSIREQRYDLNEWRVAYRAFHALSDWWTLGHTQTQ